MRFSFNLQNKIREMRDEGPSAVPVNCTAGCIHRVGVYISRPRGIADVFHGDHISLLLSLFVF